VPRRAWRSSWSARRSGSDRDQLVAGRRLEVGLERVVLLLELGDHRVERVQRRLDLGQMLGIVGNAGGGRGAVERHSGIVGELARPVAALGHDQVLHRPPLGVRADRDVVLADPQRAGGGLLRRRARIPVVIVALPEQAGDGSVAHQSLQCEDRRRRRRRTVEHRRRGSRRRGHVVLAARRVRSRVVDPSPVDDPPSHCGTLGTTPAAEVPAARSCP
jgi:hypothetical protein